MNRSGQLPNLEKLFKDDEEQDFTPLGGSNLAAIFDNSLKSNDPTSLLKPQQQKKIIGDKNSINQPSSSSSSPAIKTEVIIAKVVHAYKLQNGQYTLIGKLGIALTGNIATNTYVLILYKNKSEHISVAKLTSDFSYTVRENNYATYYDSYNDNWSILFENIEACIELAREIGVSKYFLRQDKSDENVFYQDLMTSSEGEEAKQDDKVSVKYSIITNIIQPLKINTSSIYNSIVEITTDNNWERSLIGTRKNMKRILFLSPSKQISLGPGFPRDKDIALDIEIIDVIQPEPAQILSSNPIASSGKASLISRMAKMGQSILPKIPSSTATDSEDTEEEVHVKSPRRSRNVELPEVQRKSPQSNKSNSSVKQFTEMPISADHFRGLQRNVISSSIIPNQHGSILSTVPYPNVWGSGSIQQQYYSTVDGQLYPVQSTVSQSMSQAVDPNINIFLSESRTHNAEIRMGMSKIADNVQKLLDKFHVLEVQNATSPNNEKTLESSLKMLLALKNEKTNIDTVEINKNSAINESSGDIISKEELKKLEDDLNTTKKSLDECLNRLDVMNIEKKNINLEKLELEKQIQKVESSLSDKQNDLQKALNDLKNTNETTMKYQKDNAILEAKIMTLEAKLKVLEDAVVSNSKNPINQMDKAAEIKQIINTTYQILISKFTEDCYATDYIKTTITKTMRAITLQVLKSYKNNVIPSHTPNDILPKESTRNSSITSEACNKEATSLRDDRDSSNSETRLNPTLRDEPPPIPPMDLDINPDNDWLL